MDLLSPYLIELIKIMKVLIAFLLICASFSTTVIKYNNRTLINQEPKLIDSVKNGQKLLIGDLNDPERNILYIANVKGTPFEMG